MDAVTGLSGSGPAYVFHMIEAMAQAGMSQGLAPDLAMQLARATVIGAAKLADDSPDSAATLRQNVTSPNGTTAAALAVLMDEATGLPPADGPRDQGRRPPLARVGAMTISFDDFSKRSISAWAA